MKVKDIIDITKNVGNIEVFEVSNIDTTMFPTYAALFSANPTTNIWKLIENREVVSIGANNAGTLELGILGED